jgi:ubiquinone biosynthesis monooxygenase Coq7
MRRHFSPLDRLLIGINHQLDRLHAPKPVIAADSPAHAIADVELSAAQQQHHAGLMRIDHTGEVCAQALYQGQAFTARSAATRTLLLDSAAEEYSHLCWCEQRLQQLDAKPSLLNPLFYAGSFAMGAAVGTLGDKISLGFIAATEELVGEHLQSHLQQMQDSDPKSQAVLQQMHTDELTHAHKARLAGGWYFPPFIKNVMLTLSKVMVYSSYRV